MSGFVMWLQDNVLTSLNLSYLNQTGGQIYFNAPDLLGVRLGTQRIGLSNQSGRPIEKQLETILFVFYYLNKRSSEIAEIVGLLFFSFQSIKSSRNEALVVRVLFECLIVLALQQGPVEIFELTNYSCFFCLKGLSG